MSSEGKKYLFNKPEVDRIIKHETDARISKATHKVLDEEMSKFLKELIRASVCFARSKKTVSAVDGIKGYEYITKKKVITDYRPEVKRVKVAEESNE